MNATQIEQRADQVLLHASLEFVAASGIDIVPELFARFFAAWPHQRDCFNRPQATQGAMVTEMLDLLIAQAAGEEWVAETVKSCVARHDSYTDITIENFEESLVLLVETLANAAGDDWQPSHSIAWNRQLSAILAHVR